MADLALYYFFHIVPLFVVVVLPLYFIIRPLRWGFEEMEQALTR